MIRETLFNRPARGGLAIISSESLICGLLILAQRVQLKGLGVGT